MTIWPRTGWAWRRSMACLLGARRWKASSPPFRTPPTPWTTCSSPATEASGVATGRRPQQGEWQGIAASGRNVTWTVIIIGRFAGGKLIEDWVELDRLGLFQQLGCIPTGS